MKIYAVAMSLLFCPAVIAAEIYQSVPSHCDVIESFTLFSNAQTKHARVKELASKSGIRFDAVVFSTTLYKLQKTKEETEHEKWQKKQDRNLIVDPNFVGVPKGMSKYQGVLLECRPT